MLGLASISSHRTGAWRAWTIARDLDPQGCGQVGKRHLLNRLNELQVSHRQVRRWLTAAHRLGLWTEKQGRLYLVSLAKAAYKLGAPQVGQAAMIDQSALVSKNWRAFVWAGFIATLHDRPISQAKKWDLTGIDPRTQRNYQKQFESNRRGNYAQTDLKPKHIGGMMETEGGAYFVGHNHQVIRRLPDIVNVPDTVSKAAPKGRSRKAQKLLNSLFYEEQRNEQFFRLFCETPKQVTAVERQISRDDRFPWEKPRELYQLKYAGRANNLYTTISMGAVL